MTIKVRFLLILLSLLMIGGSSAVDTVKSKADKYYLDVIQNIAKDIDKLKTKYPQLKQFDPVKNLNAPGYKIQYEYKCHESNQRSGWVSMVPNPDADGIWFYICIWDPKDPEQSSSQLNTQPAMPPKYLKDRKVTFLILQGKKTKSISDEIYAILKKYGVKETK